MPDEELDRSLKAALGPHVGRLYEQIGAKKFLEFKDAHQFSQVYPKMRKQMMAWEKERLWIITQVLLKHGK